LKLTITKINYEEAFQYAELKIQIWNDCYKHMLPDTYLNNISVNQKATKYKHELLTDPTVAYYFIILLGAPIGVLKLQYYKNPANERCVCIKDLYLLPQHQNKGYGGIVFAFIKEEAVKNNCHFITAYVIEKNKSVSIQIKKLGFRETTNKQVHDKTMTIAIEYCLDLYNWDYPQFCVNFQTDVR